MTEQSSKSKICPTCGTRLNENATRCLVCGKTFSDTTTGEQNKVQGPRMPALTLSLPIALLLMAVLLVIGAGIVYMLLRGQDKIVEPTITPTASQTVTVTITPTASQTPTPQATATELPPVEYIVKDGDLCSSIAALFDVSIQSIILANNLAADCQLFVSQVLLIPQPTPTASPFPTSTLSEMEATEDACEKLDYEVKEGDTLSGIAQNYNISIDTIKDYNGLTTDGVYQGQFLVLPLCRRNPTPGPTPTPTLPPPYPAANLLQPSDGQVFQTANETITLQWAAVGTLRDNEAYAVTIEDLTTGSGEKLTEYVVDTKFIIPSSFRPNDSIPHIIRWSVMPVRQTGTTIDGQPIWDSAGTRSIPRVFSWWGSSIASPTP